MNKQNTEPPMISVSHIQNRVEMDKFIHSLLINVIQSLAYSRAQDWTGAIVNKTGFYLTGMNSLMEKDIRELIDHYRNEFPGYIIRLTKRAHFDAMLSVTITRRIDSNPRYMTIMG